MAEDGSEMFVMDERIFRTITFYHQTENGEYPLDENLESDGTLALIRLIAMTQTLINRGMTIFLDEQPAGIHEQALQYLISCYLRLSADCQLIVAGQDTSFLSYKKLRRDSIRIFKKDDDGNTYLFKDADNRLFMSNTNVRNFVQNNLDIFRIEDDTNIDDLFEQLRIMYLRRKGKKE
jgi:predicted ATPase